VNKYFYVIKPFEAKLAVGIYVTNTNNVTVRLGSKEFDIDELALAKRWGGNALDVYTASDGEKIYDSRKRDWV